MKHIRKTFKKIIVSKMKGKEDNIKIDIRYIDFDIKYIDFNDKLSPQVNLDINDTHLSSVTLNAIASRLII